MSLNYVQLSLDLFDGSGNFPTSGTATFIPSAVLTDAGTAIIGQIPVVVSFHAAGVPVVKLLATDNAGITPLSWTWGVTFAGVTGAPALSNFSLAYANGASQFLSQVD